MVDHEGIARNVRELFFSNPATHWVVAVGLLGEIMSPKADDILPTRLVV